MKRVFLWLLAFAGVANCVFVPLLFAASMQLPFFLLPGLYFIEIAALGLLGVVSVVRAQSTPSGWLGNIPWITAGVLLAFNILGAWTIGLFLIPGTVSFLGVGFFLAERQKIWQGLGLFLVAAIAQAGLMLALIGIV